MDKEIVRVRVTFTEAVLGTLSTKSVTTEYIAKREGYEIEEEELDALPEVLERESTVFPKDENGMPFMWNYQFKGFLKNAAQVFNGKIDDVKALKSKTENLVFVLPRKIELHIPNFDPANIEHKERPLRAQTPRGERIALARSEMIPAGTWFDIELHILPGQITRDILLELMTYGEYEGLLQWRNAGFGTFTFEVLK